MRRSRKARQAGESQLAFDLDIEIPVAVSVPGPPRAPHPMPTAITTDNCPVPFRVHAIFRLANGHEFHSTVHAVSSSRANVAAVSAQLVARMRATGWQFVEGTAKLTELLEIQTTE